MSRIITCEQVSDGNPDKICDQIADAIVTDVLKHDKKAKMSLNCFMQPSQVILAGELISEYEPVFPELAYGVFEKVGSERLGVPQPYFLSVYTNVSRESPDTVADANIGRIQEPGIAYGYATAETPEMMPIPYAIATTFLRLLRHHPSPIFWADAKAQVSYDYDSGKITTFLCNVQHSPDAEVADFRHIIEGLMILAAGEYGLNGNFVKMVNPAENSAHTGFSAKYGASGQRLACDTYGGIGKIGGYAICGQDPWRVGRFGAYMARKIAKDILLEYALDSCEVQLAYTSGASEPVGVYALGAHEGSRNVETFNFRNYVRANYDLTPRGIIAQLGLLNVDYNRVSAYGHFGKLGMPWEE